MFGGYITLYSMDTPYTYTYIHIYTYKYNVRYASCTCKEFNLEIEEFYENMKNTAESEQTKTHPSLGKL